jgi:predicted RNase H-like nuclease (RuvC/YqgF family)
MNPAFAKLLKQKKKRERDPNLPPPPTLLGQVKELRLTREVIERMEIQITALHQRMEYLESRNRRLESTVEALENWIRNRGR